MTRIFVLMLLSVLALFFVPGQAMAQDSRAAIEARIKDRFSKLEAYRDQGKIGEVVTGLTEPVDPSVMSDATLKALVDAENADRTALFAVIAKEEGGKVNEVATAYARRLFELAKPQHYLKGKNGVWIKKADVGKR